MADMDKDSVGQWLTGPILAFRIGTSVFPGAIPEYLRQEVPMAAYVWLVVAILSRVVPHHDSLNFTAVGGALLYFGARRPWREMLAPMAALIATDYVLTVFSYHYPFRLEAYITTWAWYLMAMALGHILLHAKTTFVRVAAGVVLGPPS